MPSVMLDLEGLSSVKRVARGMPMDIAIAAAKHTAESVVQTAPFKAKLVQISKIEWHVLDSAANRVRGAIYVEPLTPPSRPDRQDNPAPLKRRK